MVGQLGFVLAALGSAVGLGNIWRFPNVAYDNGGGAFIIPYLVALLTAGVPLLLLDYSLGHRLRGAAPTVFRRLGRRFEGLGWFQVAVCFVIATYYMAIIVWALRYTLFSLDLTAHAYCGKRSCRWCFLVLVVERGFLGFFRPDVDAVPQVVLVSPTISESPHEPCNHGGHDRDLRRYRLSKRLPEDSLRLQGQQEAECERQGPSHGALGWPVTLTRRAVHLGSHIAELPHQESADRDKRKSDQGEEDVNAGHPNRDRDCGAGGDP